MIITLFAIKTIAERKLRQLSSDKSGVDEILSVKTVREICVDDFNVDPVFSTKYHFFCR